MSRVYEGRWTARLDPAGATVFLIGMRFNQPWRVDRWWPVFRAMITMMTHFGRHRDTGMLGCHRWFGRTTVLVSYWRDTESLLDFAANSPHAEAWRAFNRTIGGDGSVGIWHETYEIRPGATEVLYVNMPRFGLARAGEHELVDASTTTARRRMHGRGADNHRGAQR